MHNYFYNQPAFLGAAVLWKCASSWSNPWNSTLLNPFLEHKCATFCHVSYFSFIRSCTTTLEAPSIAKMLSFSWKSDTMHRKMALNRSRVIMFFVRWFSEREHLPLILLKVVWPRAKGDWGLLHDRRAPSSAAKTYLCNSSRPRRPQSRQRKNRRCHFLSWRSRSGTGAHGRLTGALQGKRGDEKR